MTAAPGSPGRGRSARRRAGLVLVLALVMLAILSGLALALLGAAHTALASAESAARTAALHAAAMDAARRALQRLAADDDRVCDHPGEPWAKPEDRTDPQGIRVRTRIEDEDRRFDVNNLAIDPSAGETRRPPEDIVIDLLALCGDPAASLKVAAIRDWVDADQRGPFETPWYHERRKGDAAANRPLYSWLEWTRIAGCPRSYLANPAAGLNVPAPRAKTAAVLTVIPGEHTRPTPVNLNTAPPETLLGLFGLDQEPLVGAVVSLREADPLRSIEPLAVLADPLRMDRLRPYVALSSRHFTVEALAEKDGRSACITALARRESGGDVRVLRWGN